MSHWLVEQQALAVPWDRASKLFQMTEITSLWHSTLGTRPATDLAGRNLAARFLSIYSQVAPTALLLGLAFGIVEGLLDLALRFVPGFSIRTTADILLIAPIFNLLLFLLIGAVLSVPFVVIATRPSLALIAGVLSGVVWFGWFLVVGQLHQIAALLLSLGIAFEIGRRLRGRERAVQARLSGALMILAALALGLGLIGTQWDSWREHEAVSHLPPAPQNAPNVLLIALDALRADHVSAYGYKRTTTPNLDQLAHQGVLFENAFANSSWTLPSHASLFTGRLPHEHKADWSNSLDGTYPTLAETLAARGYLTAAFAANVAYVVPETGLARGFAHFQVYGNSLAEDANRTVYGRKLALNLLPRLGYYDLPGRKSAARVNEEFLNWLNQNEGRPFFAFLNYFDVHDPYLTSTPYAHKFSDQVADGSVINYQFQSQAFRRKPVVTPQESQMEMDAYDGALAYLDTQAGVLLSELARRGLEKNTLVIATSDHGESFGNHDLYGHGNSLYLESLHVPLIFYWQGRIPSGRQVDRIVSLHQIPATILDLIGDTPSVLPGVSLAKMWSNDAGRDTSSDVVVAELSPGRFKDGPANYPVASGALKSLISSEWQFIESDSGGVELYAWRADRDEVHNLAETAAGQALVQGLKLQLQELVPASSTPRNTTSQMNRAGAAK